MTMKNKMTDRGRRGRGAGLRTLAEAAALFFSFALPVLLCGCEAESREEIVFVGSPGLTAPGAAGEVCPGGEPAPGAAGGAFGEIPAEPQESAPERIRVFVCGAVVRPGVVEVPSGGRAEDALSAAGGFAEDAAREAVNLADWITDGQMLYFPTRQEAAVEAETAGRGGALPQNAKEKPDGLVNINTAGVSQLCTLPGIGESRAADIIAYRERHGGFQSCEDIMKVSGIKTSVYEKICDKITVRQ